MVLGGSSTGDDEVDFQRHQFRSEGGQPDWNARTGACCESDDDPSS